MSHLRAFRPVVPSESLVGFMKHATKALETFDFMNDNPLLETEVYAIHSLRVTLFERRARAGHDASDLLTKLHVVMAPPKITTTERRRSRPGVFETVRRTEENPLIRALASAEELYTQDGEAKVVLRSMTIVDCTEDDFKDNGRELALLIDDSVGLKALDAQRGILDDKAQSLNAAKRLSRPLQQDQPLVIPFMVAPFDSEGQRDEYIDSLTYSEPVHLPVYGIGVAPIKWQLKT
jgi:hypothetical protein